MPSCSAFDKDASIAARAAFEKKSRSEKGNSQGEASLYQRLAIRYQSALRDCQETLRLRNAEVDALQLQCVEFLKSLLQQSHADITSALNTERERVQRQATALEDYPRHVATLAEGEVPSTVPSPYHASNEADLQASQDRMKTERMRLLQMAVMMHNAMQVRMGYIAKCAEELESQEQVRQASAQDVLRGLMLALTKISYTSITASHVVAQRMIHSMNEQSAINYAGMKTLLAQLRHREILKYRLYCSEFVSIYTETLDTMTRSSLLWVRTLFQSASFRRPACRMSTVERISSLSTQVRREGVHFLQCLGIVVCSLRHARDAAASDIGQTCGGTVADGWLRQYDGQVQNEVFPTHPAEVVDEWRMKANVVVRNCLSSCAEIMDVTRREEMALLSTAQYAMESLFAVVKWVYTPLEEEAALLQRASLDSSEIDEVYRQLIYMNADAISNFRLNHEPSLKALMAEMENESSWFVGTIEKGLQHSHRHFEQLLLTDFNSVLHTFGKATDEVALTASVVLGLFRSFHRQQTKQAEDFHEQVERLEASFAKVTTDLMQAGTAHAAQEMFIEGLECLERIRAAHTEFYSVTTQQLSNIGSEVHDLADEQCRKLRQKLGFELVHETEQRIEEERRRRREEALAEAQREMALVKRKGKRTEDAVKETSNMSTCSDDVSVERVDYPQFVGHGGTVCNIVGPMVLQDGPLCSLSGRPVTGGADTSSLASLAEKPTVSQGSPSFPVEAGQSLTSRNATEDERGVVEKSVPAHVPEAAAEGVVSSFAQYYLPFFYETVQHSENFIAGKTVADWMELLCGEVFNWLLDLIRFSDELVKTYTSTTQLELNETFNNTTRHHRRRPAAFQADVYEARVRELEGCVNTAEKYCSRLSARVDAVDALWNECMRDPAIAAEDGRLFAELAALEASTGEAGSTYTLQQHIRQFTTLSSQVVEGFAQRRDRTLADLTQHQSVIMAECDRFLAERAREMGTHRFQAEMPLQEAMEKDPITQRVRSIADRLRSLGERAQDEAASEWTRRTAVVEELRARYRQVCDRHLAELQTVARLQEIFAKLKTGVHSLLLSSKVSETEVEEMVCKLESKLSTSMAQANFALSIYQCLQKDLLRCSSGKDVADEFTNATETVALSGMMERVQSTSSALHRLVHDSDVNELLHLLGDLRGRLSSRGTFLDILAYSVEMARVHPDHYVEPVRLTSKVTGQADGSVSIQRGGRRPKGTKQVAGAFLYDLPPPATSAVSELQELIAAAQIDVAATAETHFTRYAQPMSRRLPGMPDGTRDSVQKVANEMYAAQESRLQEHLKGASKVYRQQVQRVHVALCGAPEYLVSSVFTLSAAILEKRVCSVFAVGGDFYSHSAALRRMHRRVTKVSLGSLFNQDRFRRLLMAEATRHTVTEKVLVCLLGNTLREVQEEAGMHAVRCTNVTAVFFGLLRGIVSPSHLHPGDGSELIVGRHHGLKHLLRMRAQKDQLRDWDRGGTPGGVRERRQQETTATSKSDGGKSKGAVAEGYGSPPYPHGEVEFPGLPLALFKPLDPFNTEHPMQQVEAVLPGNLYYPVPEMAGMSSAPGGETGIKGASRKKMTELSDACTMVSPPLIAPSSPHSQETVALAKQAVLRFNTVAQETADVLNKVVQTWLEEETMWDRTWVLTVDRLQQGSGGSLESVQVNGMDTGL